MQIPTEENSMKRLICGEARVRGHHFSMVESAATAAGIPDIDFCIKGHSGHIECKWNNWVVRPALRPTQKRWMSRRIKAGGRPCVVVGNGNGVGIVSHEGVLVEDWTDWPLFRYWEWETLRNPIEWDSFFGAIVMTT